MRTKILHLISNLDVGGAEMILFQLVKCTDRSIFEPVVVSLTTLGSLGKDISEMNIPVFALGMQRGKFDPARTVHLMQLINSLKPDLVQSWMYHADFLGGLACLANRIPLVWGIHNTVLEPGQSKQSTILTRQLCARLSYLAPRMIVCCADAAKQAHIALGYDTRKMFVIPNGIDTERFKPALPDERKQIRYELGIRETDVVVGLVARFDPLKDHHNFISAAGKVKVKNDNVSFVLCGRGCNWQNNELKKWIDEWNLRANIHLLDQRPDVPQILKSFDILAVSSYGEAWPVALGEGMASGLPSVTTDVGDAANIIGDSGIVVRPRDSTELAKGFETMISLGAEARRVLGARARRRIEQHFSLARTIDEYSATHLACSSRKQPVAL